MEARVTYNDKCPVCNGPVLLTGFTVRHCEMPIRDTGWALMATQRHTDGTEMFSCNTCQVTVPSEWVYQNQSQKEATTLMKSWGANVYSIHNNKPLPPEDELPAVEIAQEEVKEETAA